MDDVHLAVRRLRASPGFAAAAVTTLALAIGANTAVFGLVDSVLLARLPFPRPESIVRLWEERLARGWSRFGVSAPAFRDWRAQAPSLAHVAAYTRRSANLASAGEPRRVLVVETTPALAEVLGVRPLRGRFFGAEEAHRGRDRVAVLAHTFWKSAFAEDPGVVGRTVTLDGLAHEVVGVLPPETAAAFDDTQVFTPLVLDGDERRGARWLEVMGRAAPGATPETVQAEMDVLARRHERDHPVTNRGWTVAVAPLQDVRADGPRPVLLAVWAGVLIVLLITCANLASLMGARAADRETELAIRAALGAPAARLARLVAMEGVLLAVLGGLAGAVVAVAGRAVLVRVLEGVMGAIPASTFDVRTSAFLAAATLAAGLAFGIAPGVRARRAAREPALRAGGRGTTPQRLRARRALVAAEIAVAVVLLSGAGVLVRSVKRLLDVPPGFEPRGALALRVAPVQSKPAEDQSEEEFVRSYLAERDRTAVFYGRLLERLRSLPGVTAAGAVNRLPLTGRWWSIGVAGAGEPPAPPGDTPSAAGRVATPGYFEAMHIPLRSGRLFTAGDQAGTPAVSIVSESLARRTWPGRDPVGRVLVVDDSTPTAVVGVVADARVNGLDSEAPPIVYVPFAQARFGLFPDWGMDIVVRADGDATALASAVRGEVAALDRALPVFAVRTLDDVLGGWMARRRAALVLVGAFAAVAVALAMVGLYGVVSYSVRQRTREIGVRMALGARPRDIGGLVLGEGLLLAGAGAVVGLALSAGTSRVLSSLLFEVKPGDPVTLAATAGVVAVVATLAAGAPSRRASRLDPVVALRQD
jgi:putative ABC transport system permease protein